MTPVLRRPLAVISMVFVLAASLAFFSVTAEAQSVPSEPIPLVDVCPFDADQSGTIDRDEAINALAGYLIEQTIDRDQAINIVIVYLFQFEFDCFIRIP